MSCWTKPELENMLEDVVNELTLSAEMVEKHGQEGTAPAELVRLVLEEKNRQISMLKRGFKQIELKYESQQLPIPDLVVPKGTLCKECGANVYGEPWDICRGCEEVQ